MKKILPLCALAVLLGMSGRLTAQVQTVSEFWKEFASALRLEDMDAMVKATRKYKIQARDEFCARIQILLADEGKASTKSKQALEALKRAWRRAIGDDLLENFEKLMRGMDPATRKERWDLERTFRSELGRRITAAQKTPDPGKLPKLIEDLKTIAKKFEGLGDGYWASEAWYWCAEMTNDAQQQMISGTPQEAIAAYEKAESLRRDFGVVDNITLGSAKKAKALKAEESGEASGPGEKAAGPAFAKGSRWWKGPLTVEPVKRMATIKWTGHLSDDLISDWLSHAAGAADGTSSPINFFPGEPVVHRVGATHFWFDMNKDQKPDGEFKIGAKPQIVKVMRPAGKDGSEPYYFYVGFGSSQESVQGLSMNYAPSTKQAAMFLRSATAKVGRVLDENESLDFPIKIFDENVSGEFGDEKQYALRGTAFGEEKVPVTLLDSMLIGKAKRPVPFSGYIVQNGKVYRLKFSNEKTLAVRHMDLQTGFAKLKVSGLKLPLSCLVLGGVGPLQGAYFDLASSKKGVELPAGQYKVAIGTFRGGKGAQTRKMMVTQGSMQPIEIEAGKTTLVEIGKPFSFAFSYQDIGSAVEVAGDSIAVRGAHGELYTRFVGFMVQPEIFVRKKGGRGRGGKPTKMKICDQESLNKSSSQEIAFHPLTAEVRKPARSDVEVMLAQRGHKVFGNISSEFK